MFFAQTLAMITPLIAISGLIMKLLNTLIMLISLSLVGCATDGMNAAMGIGAISSSKTTFDNATHVDMTPAFLTDGKGNNRTQLGAKWISTMPDKVGLLLSYQSLGGAVGTTFANIRGLDVNVGGKIQSFDVIDMTQHNVGTKPALLTDTSSQNYVLIPLTLLKTMVSTPNVQLRVRLDSGFEDSSFSTESSMGGETAIVPMRKFLNTIEASRTGK